MSPSYKRLSLHTIVCFILSLCFSLTSAYAETLDDWYPSVSHIIKKSEGSTETTVTPDSDLQGLSLGVLQWNIGSGSLKKLINAVGVNEAKRIARSSMPTYGATYVKIIDLVQRRKTRQARKVSLSMQKLSSNGRKGIAMKPAAKRELAAWLGNSTVKQAQKTVIMTEMQDVAKVATSWKRQFKDRSALTFPEFMFFFNMSVQGGLGSFRDGRLADAARLVRKGSNYTNGNMGKRREMLVNYLADWLSVDWPQAYSKSYYKDAEKNAALLRKHARRLTPSQIHLLYMKYVRASVGNTPYHLPFMNRGVIDIIGEGYVNQSYHNYRDIYRQRKPLD